MSDARELEQQIDEVINHPIGRTLLMNIRPDAQQQVVITPKGCDALVEELYALTQRGEMLDDAFNELFRIGGFLTEEQRSSAVEDAIVYVINRLGERLGGSATRAAGPELTNEQRRQRAGDFLGTHASPRTSDQKTAVAGFRPWQIDHLKNHGDC